MPKTGTKRLSETPARVFSTYLSPTTLHAFMLLVVGLGVPYTVQAQGIPPPYDHPLFTGPVHDVAGVASFDQQHLRLAVRLDLAAQAVEGEATLTLVAVAPQVDSLVLHAAALAIDSVQVGIRDSVLTSMPFRLGGGDALIIALPPSLAPGRPFDVRMTYRATPKKGLVFITPTRNQPAPKHQVWSQGRPEEVRHWIPLLDTPSDKLTTELLVTVEAPLRVLSNGQLLEEQVRDGEVTAHYLQSQPQPPHHIALAVGAYDVKRTLFASERGLLPLEYWVDPTQIGDVPRTFGRTPAMMRFFTDRLAYPYPWAKYAQVALRNAPFEGQGQGSVTSLAEHVLLDERAVAEGNADGLLARALAQQWFGALLTARHWSESWLEESLVTYLATLFIEHDRGESAFDKEMRALAEGYLAEATSYRRPLIWNQWEAPGQMLDAHSMQKGAWVLHMLRLRIGEDAFWEVLRSIIAEHAFGTIETADLQALVSSVTQADETTFFDQWVVGAGHPVLDVSYQYSAVANELSMTVFQRQEGFRVPTAFQFPLTVAAHTLTDQFRFDVEVTQRQQTFTVSVPQDPRFLVVDPDQTLLAEVDLEQPARAWVAQIRRGSTPESRIQAARALVAFEDDPALLIGLRGALGSEPSAAVRYEMIRLIGALPPSSAIERLLLEASDDQDPSVRQAILVALRPYTGSQAAIDRAFQAAQNDRSYRVQAAAVHTLAALGAPGALDVVRSALVTPSHRDVIRQAAFEALALLDLPATQGLAFGQEHSGPQQPSAVRAAALRYLGTLASANNNALTRLIEALDDPDYTVRQATIATLGSLDLERAREALQQRLEIEPYASLQRALRAALQASSADGAN